MKIVATGGAGYIGSITAHHLLKQGHDVTVVDDLSYGHADNVPKEKLRVIRIQNIDALAEILKGADAVLHFAGFIAVGESVAEPEKYFENNLGGSLSLFKAMRQAEVKHLVFSSTAAVYGEPKIIPIRENSPIAPVNPYGKSKAMIEEIMRELDNYRGLRSVALRYFNACGAEPDAKLGERHTPETHIIPLLFKAIETGKPINIFGNDYPTSDGTCLRDYIHVTDLAQAHILALDYLMKGGASDFFNVGTGEGHTVLELLKATEEVTGKKVPYIISPRRSGDPASLVANTDKIQEAFGWKPMRSSLKDIVSDAWKFYEAMPSITTP